MFSLQRAINSKIKCCLLGTVARCLSHVRHDIHQTQYTQLHPFFTASLCIRFIPKQQAGTTLRVMFTAVEKLDPAGFLRVFL